MERHIDASHERIIELIYKDGKLVPDALFLLIWYIQSSEISER